jgi:hypothetical protein
MLITLFVPSKDSFTLLVHLSIIKCLDIANNTILNRINGRFLLRCEYLVLEFHFVLSKMTTCLLLEGVSTKNES